MKRFFSMVLVICFMFTCGSTVFAAGLQTSSYAKADSYMDMQFLFESFDTAAAQSGGKLTTAMVATALGRYHQIDTYIGTGTGSVKSDDTPLMAQPDTNSNVIRSLNKRMVLTATEFIDGWYLVHVDGSKGYVSEDCADIYCEKYTELPFNAWYTPYMIWAYELGILNTTNPHKTLTREELAVVLVDAAKMLGFTFSELNPAYTFADTDQFTNGLDAATTLQTAGIIREKADGTFGPSEKVRISEAEGIFLRYFPNLQPIFDMRCIPTNSMGVSAPVSDSWFDDALFIGHSQVAGMSHYFKLPNIEYFCIIGHTAQEALDYPYYELSNGRMGPLREGLELDQYGKVYIMLGINDCTSKPDQLEKFLAPMKEIIEMVQETQPNAEIYLISLAPIGRETPNNICYTLENVILFTQAVKALSREYNTEYLDVFRLMSDEHGYMLNEYNAGDGIHIDAHHYDEILEYIRCHTV